MMKKNKPVIPRKSLLLFLICGGIILLLVIFVMVPLYVSNGKKVAEAKKIRQEIEARKVNELVYLDLQKALASAKQSVLPNPKRTTVSPAEAEQFQNAFRSMAQDSGLSTISYTVEGSESSPSGFLVGRALVKGELANFRKMLVALSTVSYLDKIDEISVVQRSDAMEFRIKIWLALNS